MPTSRDTALFIRARGAGTSDEIGPAGKIVDRRPRAVVRDERGWELHGGGVVAGPRNRSRAALVLRALSAGTDDGGGGGGGGTCGVATVERYAELTHA